MAQQKQPDPKELQKGKDEQDLLDDDLDLDDDDDFDEDETDNASNRWN